MTEKLSEGAMSWLKEQLSENVQKTLGYDNGAPVGFAVRSPIEPGNASAVGFHFHDPKFEEMAERVRARLNLYATAMFAESPELPPETRVKIVDGAAYLVAVDPGRLGSDLTAVHVHRSGWRGGRPADYIPEGAREKMQVVAESSNVRVGAAARYSRGWERLPDPCVGPSPARCVVGRLDTAATAPTAKAFPFRKMPPQHADVGLLTMRDGWAR